MHCSEVGIRNDIYLHVVFVDLNPHVLSTSVFQIWFLMGDELFKFFLLIKTALSISSKESAKLSDLKICRDVKLIIKIALHDSREHIHNLVLHEGNPHI